MNRETYGLKSWSDIDENSAVLVFGLPTFEAQPADVQSTSRAYPAAAIRRTIDTSGFSSLYTGLGGVFLVVFVDRGVVKTTSTFCGYGSVLFHQSPGLLIVGNKLPLILSMMPAARRSANLQAAASICSTTMILGDQTAYAEIRKSFSGL